LFAVLDFSRCSKRFLNFFRIHRCVMTCHVTKHVHQFTNSAQFCSFSNFGRHAVTEPRSGGAPRSTTQTLHAPSYPTSRRNAGPPKKPAYLELLPRPTPSHSQKKLGELAWFCVRASWKSGVGKSGVHACQTDTYRTCFGPELPGPAPTAIVVIGGCVVLFTVPP
jgi:hypothetical protein